MGGIIHYLTPYLQDAVLASSSPYRRQLLTRLGIEFEQSSPDIDESALAGESPVQLVERLSYLKANKLAERFNKLLIIASDQVAELNGHILCKPGNRSRASQQLQDCSGQSVTFFTALQLLNSATGGRQQCVERFTVHFRSLTEQQIIRYINNTFAKTLFTNHTILIESHKYPFRMLRNIYGPSCFSFRRFEFTT